MSDHDEENKKPQKRATLDRIFMGAVIGGAIGSVLGASIAPKKGKETRKEIVEAVKNTGKTSKKIFHKLKEFFSFKKKNNTPSGSSELQPPTHASIKKIPNEDAVEIEQ